MRKLFTCLIFLCAVCIWITPAQAAAVYEWEKTSIETNARVYVSPLYETDNCVYALAGSNLYLSRDEGITWRQISTMPVHYVQVAFDNNIYLLVEETDEQMAIYSFDSIKEQWHKKCSAPANTKTFAVLVNTGIMLAAKQHENSSMWQILRTSDGGQTWNNVNYNRGGYLFAPAPDGNTVFTREYNKNLGSYSTNGGDKWKAFSAVYEIDNIFVSPDYLNDHKMFAICNRANIYYTSDLGTNWSTATRGLEKGIHLSDISFSRDYASDKTIYAADQRGHIYISNTSEIEWVSMDIELPSGVSLNNLAPLTGSKLLAGTTNGVYTVGINKSTDTKPTQPTITTRTVTTKFRLGVSTYTINGREWDMDAYPYQENDRVYVPVRYLAYGLGIKDANIDWNNRTQEVTLTKDNTTVKMKLGSPLLYMNDQEVRMDVTPQMQASNRVMLPARWVAEAFGTSVSWDENQKVVAIQYEEPEL